MKKIIIDFKSGLGMIIEDVSVKKPKRDVTDFSDCLDFEEVVGRLTTIIITECQSMLGLDYDKLVQIKSAAVIRLGELSNETSM